MPTSGKTNSIVFFGTGPVAARSLELLAKEFTVEAVITKPTPAHHKYPAPVATIAEHLSLPLYTAASKVELDTLIAQTKFKSKLGVIIDFGIIVSQQVIQAFPLGIVNSHFSLLPRWRGADPITYAIINGDTKTGVSLMLIDEGMDTGKLLTYRTLHMHPEETTVTLTSKLITLSNDLLSKYLPLYINGDIRPKQQPHPSRATYSHKISKQDGIIDWSLPAEQIERTIRGYIEWPGSRCTLAGLDCIVTKAHVVTMEDTPGTYIIHGNELVIFAGKNALSIDTIKPAGKKEMPIAAFLAGYKSVIGLRGLVA